MLRYYQLESKQAVEFSLCEYNRTLLALPTGAGKTVVAAHLIAGWLPGRSMFLADQDELCQQPLSVIDAHGHVIPALEKAGMNASLTAKVVVGSSQTLAKKSRLERFPPKWFDYVIVDEAHRGRKRDREIVDYLAKKVVGITGTPFTADLRSLSEDYEDVAYSLTMLNLIEEGFAPPYTVLRLPVEIDLSNVGTNRMSGDGLKDYDAESLSTTIAPYYERIIQLILEHAPKRRIIVFLPLIKSSEAFAALARRAGIQAVHVDGKSPDRDEIIEGFRRGRFQLLSNSNLVTTGVDIPIADCLVNLCPMRSPIRYQQGFGRIMRVLPGVIDDLPERDQAEERRARIAASAKPDSLLIDFMWQHDKLNVYKPENMIASSPEEAAAIWERVKNCKTPADIIAIQKLVQLEREALVVKRLEEVAARSSSIRIEPETFGYLIGNKKLMEYEPLARWEMDKASDLQLNWLEEHGFNRAMVTSKGLAKKLMDAAMHRLRFKLASVHQLQALAQAGIKFDARKTTMRQATQMISEARLTAIAA